MKRAILFSMLIPCLCFGQGYKSGGGISQTYADANYLQLSGGNLTGDVTSDGYIEDRHTRAYAYLTQATTTTIASAGTWYPVEGVFSNVVLDGFSTTTVDGKPAIIYTNGYSGRFIVRLLGGVYSTSASATIGLTLKINNVTNVSSGVPTYVFCKNAGERYNLSNFGIPVITNGTTIQIMTTADNGNVVFEQLKAKMERWR